MGGIGMSGFHIRQNILLDGQPLGLGDVGKLFHSGSSAAFVMYGTIITYITALVKGFGGIFAGILQKIRRNPDENSTLFVKILDDIFIKLRELQFELQ
jgi:hypothetical protein